MQRMKRKLLFFLIMIMHVEASAQWGNNPHLSIHALINPVTFSGSSIGLICPPSIMVVSIPGGTGT